MGKKLNLETLKEYLKKVNVPRSVSTINKSIKLDKYITLANDIKQRSESLKRHHRQKSCYDRISGNKPIYPRDQLDFIRYLIILLIV
jgi:hypothetical protein